MGAMSLTGHYWTVWPVLRDRRRALPTLEAEPWSAHVEDPQTGPLRLTGRLAVNDPSTLLMIVHGLGGCVDSLYMTRAASVAEDLGVSHLRVNLRGADRDSHDFYHAGLWGDLQAALASPRLSQFENIFVLGYSVGGHVVLKLGTETSDPRVRAVAAVCSPLELETTVRHFDEPWRRPYRDYVLRGLRDTYRAVADRREVPIPVERVMAATLLREWDSLTVVPRFGFGTAENYYEEMSVGPRLRELAVPALLVAAEGDPMVTAASIRAGLGRAGQGHGLRAVFSPRGGHVGFPPDLDLDLGGGPGLESQVIGWLLEQ